MCPCLGGHIDAAPAYLNNEGFGRCAFRGSLTQPQHLLSYASRFALPLARKAGFRLAGWPLPGGRRTLWTATKGFRLWSSSSPVLLTLPSLVSIQWFSPRGVSLPSLGSRRARFPDVAGTMKAPRLPACACLLPYLFGRRSHVPSFVRVRRGALDECEGHSSSLGQFIVRRPVLPACCVVDAAGSLRLPGDPSHAFALLLDPGRADKTSPLTVLSVLPPG